MKLPTVQKRPCGGCTVCCGVMEVEEIEKPMWERCPHVSSEGCDVHHIRPDPCRGWDCYWRMDGAGKFTREDERPDKIGCFAEIHQGIEEGERPHIVVIEAWSGGLSRPGAQAMIDRFAEKKLTLVFHFGENVPVFYGPEEILSEIDEAGEFVVTTEDGPQTIWKR